MVRRRQSDLVGGYDVFKALERAQTEAAKRAPKTGRAASGQAEDVQESGSTKRVASHIGRTIMPPKHKLVCFECGFSFEITGNTDAIMCPRCRVEISLRDQVIDGEWGGDLKTGGTVEITSGGIIKSGEIIAKEVLLGGRLEGGSINAYHRLILTPGGIYDRERIETPSLVVRAGSELAFETAMQFQEIDIAGSLRARDLEISRLLAIRSGGLLRGSVSAQRLIVEDGGGLIAAANIAGS